MISDSNRAGFGLIMLVALVALKVKPSLADRMKNGDIIFPSHSQNMVAKMWMKRMQLHRLL